MQRHGNTRGLTVFICTLIVISLKCDQDPDENLHCFIVKGSEDEHKGAPEGHKQDLRLSCLYC